MMITEHGRCGVCGAVGAMRCDGGEVVCADEAGCLWRLRAGKRRGQDGEEAIDTDERDALEWVAVAARAVWREAGQPSQFRAELGEALTELDRVREGRDAD